MLLDGQKKLWRNPLLIIQALIKSINWVKSYEKIQL